MSLIENVQPLKPKDRLFNRLTVMTHIHHEQEGEQPTTLPLHFDDLLTSEEESYSRKHVATEEWQPLDFGHVTAPGLLIFENLEGRHYQVQPTEEELAAIKMRVIEIGLPDFNLLLPPRYHLPAILSKPYLAFIRCPSGQAKYRLTVMPV